MPLELCIRHRCNQCGIAIEQPAIIRGLRYPAQLPSVAIEAPPPGWTLDGDLTFCPDHPRRSIVPARVLPSDVDAVLRGAGGRGQ